MPGRYKAYPEYKDSGVEWLGEVPEHWSIHSLKHSVDGVTNGIWGGEPNGDNDLIVLRVADFNRNKLNISDDKLTYRAIDAKDIPTRLLKKGDLLIEKSGGGDKTLVGCVVLFEKDYPAVTSNFVAKMTPQEGFESSFLRYSFSQLYAGKVNFPSIKQTTGIQNLNSDAYLMESFVFPPFEEQQKIANFLDHETAKTDTLIAKQEKLIELLKEKRQAVISHAVTKGLNPDAPMKDSGVEWLGEVPEHWVVCCLKHIKGKEKGSFVDGPFGSNLKSEHFVDNGDVYVIESNFATTGVLDKSKLKTISSAHFTTISRSETKQGAIIIAKIGARYGMNSIMSTLDKKAVVSGNSLSLSVDTQRMNVNYCHHLLTHLKQEEAMDDGVNVTAQPALSLGQLNNLPFLALPLEEQNKIVSFVKGQQKYFSSLISSSEKMIDLSKERKAALISAAVTGKIDVRDWSES